MIALFSTFLAFSADASEEDMTVPLCFDQEPPMLQDLGPFSGSSDVTWTDEIEQAASGSAPITSCQIEGQLLSLQSSDPSFTGSESGPSEAQAEGTTDTAPVDLGTWQENPIHVEMPAVQDIASQVTDSMCVADMDGAENGFSPPGYSVPVSVTVQVPGDSKDLIWLGASVSIAATIIAPDESHAVEDLSPRVDNSTIIVPAPEERQGPEKENHAKNKTINRPLPAPMILVGETTGAGAAAGLASHFSNLLRWFSVHVFAPLFSRLRKEEILNNPIRERIYNEISGSPGIHYRELLRRLEISNGTLAFHLSRLERAGYVRSHHVRGRRHIRAADGGIDPTAFLATERQRQIFDIVKRRSGGASAGDIESRFSLSRSDISYNLGVLRSLGLVEVRRDQSGRARYFACDR